MVILGHSERRLYFKEDNDTLLKKVKIALKYNLDIIFCVGESLEQRENNKHFDENVANETTILYGGSCKPSNAKEIFSKKDVDGGLIGGAALKSDDFSKIIDAL